MSRFFQKVQQAAETTRNDPGMGGRWSGNREAPAPGQFTMQRRELSTGQNLQGTGNAWNQGFMNDFQQKYREEMGRPGGDTLNWFRDKKDGVALWDDKDAGIQFGDVFYGGEKVENLFETYGREFAEGVMRPMLLSASEQKNGESLERRREENTKAAAAARGQTGGSDERAFKQQKEYTEKVLAEKESWDSDTARDLSVFGGITGGAVTGAGLGAAAGAVFGGLPALPAAVVGGVVGGISGGVGAWMNRDEIQDTYARSKVTARMADEAARKATDNNRFAAWGAKRSAELSGAGALAANLFNPFGNLVHGAAEASWGEIGDGRSAYYEMNPDGSMKRSGWWTAADVGAGLLGAVGQFSTGVGVVGFQAQMAGQIGGQVGQAAFTGGQTFDDATAEFDPLFQDGDGNFKFWKGAAGLGAIGIDAVQLGMARGLMSSAGKAGTDAAKGTWGALVGTRSGARAADLASKGATGGAAGSKGFRTAVAEGRAFKVDVATGKAVGSRLSVTMLAPSEFVNAATVRLRAMHVRGINGGGKITPDDLWQATQGWATTSKAWNAALINGFGEGLEEGVQEFLEEYSHGRRADVSDALEAAMYGAAMGVGMTVGSRANLTARAQSGSKRQYDRHMVSADVLGMPTNISYREYLGKYSESERKQMDIMAPVLEASMKAAATARAQESMKVHVSTETGASTTFSRTTQAVRAASVERIVEAQSRQVNPFTSRQMTLLIAPVDQADHVALTSLNTLTEMFFRSFDGLQVAVEQPSLSREQVDLAAAVQAEVRDITRFLQAVQAEFYEGSTTGARREQLLAQVNQRLSKAWDVVPGDPASVVLARAVSAAMLRNPADNPGSLQHMLPQISMENSIPVEAGSLLGAGDNVMQVTRGITQAIGGDFDGDTIFHLTQILQTDEEYRNARMGTNLWSADAAQRVVVPVEYFEEQLAPVVAEAARQDPAVSAGAQFALEMVDDLRSWLMPRFGQWGPQSAELVDQFVEMVRQGDTKAKPWFFTQLADTFLEQMNEEYSKSWSNPWFEINTQYRRLQWDFQRKFSVANSKDVSDSVKRSGFAPAPMETAWGQVRQLQGVTATQTLWNLFRGSNIFRGFQSLSYGTDSSVDTSLIRGRDRDAHAAMSEFYNRVTSQMAQSKVEAVLDESSMLKQVWQEVRAVERLIQKEGGDTAHFTTPLVAMMAAPDYNTETGSYNYAPTSIGVVSLRRAVLKLRDAQRGLDLEAFDSKHAKYLNATPSEALMFMLEAQPANHVLGLVGDVFGTRTMGQVMREYVSKDTKGRRAMMQVLRLDSSYTVPNDESNKSNMPILLDDPAAVQYTPYQVVVDALAEAGNAVISYDKNRSTSDQVRGRIGKKSTRTQKEFRASFTKLWSNMGARPGFDRTSRAQVVEFLNDNPALVRGLLAPLSDAETVAAIGQKGQVPSWMLNAVMARTEAEAEAIFLRGKITEGWNARGAERNAEGELVGRSFYKLTDRWHLLMYRLAQPGNEYLWDQFDTRFLEMRDVDEFLAWVNDQTNGIRQSEAPFTAWASDIAEFDPLASAGKMASVLPGADTRLGVSQFHRAVENLAEAAQQQRLVEEKDARIRSDLQLGITDPARNKNAAANVKVLNETLRQYAKLSRAAGPSIYHDANTQIQLLISSATDKGKTPTPWQKLAAVTAQQMKQLFGSGEENVLSSATVSNLVDVVGRPDLLVEGRPVVLEDGTLLNWDGLTAEQYLRLEKEPEFRATLQSIFGLNMLEDTGDLDGVSLQAHSDGTLDSMISRDPLVQTFFGAGAASNGLLISAADAITGNFELMDFMHILSTVRTSAMKSGIDSFEQASDNTRQLTRDVGGMLKTVASLRNQKNSEQVEVRDEHGDLVKVTPATVIERIRLEAVEAMRNKTAKQSPIEGQDAAYKLLLSTVRNQIKADLTGKGVDQSTIDEANARLDMLDLFQNRRVLEQLKNKYTLTSPKTGQDADAWVVSNFDRLKGISDYIRARGTVPWQSSWSEAALKVYSNDVDTSNGLPSGLTPAEWQEVAGVALVHNLQNIVGHPMPGYDMLPITDLTDPNLKYYDPSYEYLFDILDDNHPSIVAVSDLMKSLNTKGVKGGSVSEAKLMVHQLFLQDKHIGPYTEAMNAAMRHALSMRQGAGAAEGVSAGGLISQKMDPLQVASTRNYFVPDPGMARKAVVKFDGLQDDTYFMSTRPDGSQYLEDAQILDGAFITGGQILHNGNVVVQDIQGMSVKPGHTFMKGGDALMNSGYKTVSQRRLMKALGDAADMQDVDLDELELHLNYFHMDDQPADQPNSVVFEGTGAEGDLDYNSLIGAWTMSPGGVAQVTQSRALDATKTGERALANPDVLTETQRRAIMDGWQVNGLGFSLRRMARELMLPGRINKGEEINPAYFKSVVKYLKMHYAGKMTDADGNVTVLSAEQLMAMQAAGESVSGIELIPLSATQVLTLLGHADLGRNPNVEAERITAGAKSVEQWNGVYTQEMLERQPGMTRPAPADSAREFIKAAQQGETKLVRARIPGMDSPAKATLYSQGTRYASQLASEIRGMRLKENITPTDLKAAAYQVEDFAGEVLKHREQINALDSLGIPVGWLGEAAEAIGQEMMSQVPAALSNAVEGATAHVFHPNPVEAPIDQSMFHIYGRENFNKGEVSSTWVAPNEWVMVLMNQYDMYDDNKLFADLDRMVNAGALIYLHSEGGIGPMHALARTYLESLDYDLIAGVKNAFRPVTNAKLTKAQEAELSVKFEMGMEEVANHSVIFNTDQVPVEENTAIKVNPDAIYGVTQNHMPVNWGNFSEVATNEMPKVMKKLEAWRPRLLEKNLELDSEYQDLVKKGRSAAAAQRKVALDKSLNKALDKVANNSLLDNGFFGVGHQLERGDITLHQDGRTKKVMLYRHGHRPADPGAVDQMLSEDDFNLYSPVEDKQLTANDGEVLSIERTPEGRRIVLKSDLQDIGAKMLHVGDGFKNLLYQAPAEWKLKFPELWAGRQLDLVNNQGDVASKNAFEGTLRDVRTASKFLGLDFRPALARYIFGDDTAESISGVETWLQEAQATLPRTGRQQTDINLSQAALEHGYLNALLRTMEQNGAEQSQLDKISGMLDANSVDARIFQATILYLMFDKGKTSDILYTTGAAGENARELGVRTRALPGVFTQFFDDTAQDDPLRTWFIGEFQKVFPNQGTSTDGRALGYTLLPNWEVQMSNENAEFNWTGHLQFVELVSAEANPVYSESSQARSSRQGANRQQGQIINTLAGLKINEKDVEKGRALAMGEGLTDMSDVAELRAMYRNVPVESHVNTGINFSAGERAYMEWRLSDAASLMESLNMENWDAEDVTKVNLFVADVAAYMGLTESQHPIVHAWVRQHVGRPAMNKRQARRMTKAEFDEAMNSTNPSAIDVLGALEQITSNINEGILPTAYGWVPQMSLPHLAALFQNSVRGAKFQLRTKLGDPGSVTTDFNDWVKVAIGHGDVVRQRWDPAFQHAHDAMLNTYMDLGIFGPQASVTSDLDLGIELKQIRDLTDLAASDFITSNPYLAQSLKRDHMSTRESSHQNSVLWNRNISGQNVDNTQKRLFGWRARKQKGATPGGDGTFTDMQRHGTRIVGNRRSGAGLITLAGDLRALLALADPRVWLGTPIETFQQTMMDDITGTVTGTNLTPGLMGQFLGKIIEAGTLGQVSVVPKAKEQQRFREAINTLAEQPAFINMVRNDVKMDRDWRGENRTATAVGRAAEWAGMKQDVYSLMTQRRVAKSYVNTLVRNIEAEGSLTNISPEYIATQLMMDGRWAENSEYNQAHQKAMNTLKNIKCVKATTLGLAWRSFVDPMTGSGRGTVAWPSTLFIRLPYMFMNYGVSTTIRMSGLQGVDAIAAAFLTGKEKGPLNRLYKTALTAVTGDDHMEEKGEAFYDFSEVLEDVDLSHQVVKGGITMTGLLAAGMLAGTFGLAGEDEEEKRLRRIAKLQGSAYMYDARDIANDFRNADALFLDKVPLLNELFRVTVDDDETGIKGRSMAQMNFILKQVISPMLGVSKFMSNGNPNEIVWGFEDALSSLPLINTMGWADATATYEQLLSAGEERDTAGGADDLPEVFRYFMNAVFTLERNLLESSFANMIYTGVDKWDRDPWAKVKKDEGGKTMYEDGLPMESDTLQEFVDPDTGEIRKGYESKTWIEAQLAAYNENRFTVAALTELVTLGRADAFRSNMPVKTRSFKREELDLGQSGDLIRSLYASAQGEGLPIKPWQFEKDQLPEGVNIDQAEGVIRAMWKGAQMPKDLNLEGFYLSKDMREELTAILRKEVYDDAIALGLKPKEADRRVDNVWYGPHDNPEVPGLYDIIWSKNGYEGTIPSKQSDKYRQLNTTYMKGPDGKFWATGVSRSLFYTLFGMNPLHRYQGSDDTKLGTDGRLNTTDAVRGINTGMRSLTRIGEVPDMDYTPSAKEAAENAGGKFNSEGSESGWIPNKYGKKSGWIPNKYGRKGSGWRNFGKRRGSGWKNFGKRKGGGGGGGGSFTRLNAPERGQVPYANTHRTVGAGNPLIRRATIRRERSDSDRGRLKPWQ